MAKRADKDMAELARHGYANWLRKMRLRAHPDLAKRYANEVTQHDAQKFFGFTSRELVELLGGRA